MVQLSLPELGQDLLAQSIQVVRNNEPNGGYYGCFSGGKDSIVLRRVTELAGVQVAWHYNQTTLDPPELIRYIREHHNDVKWVKPRHGNFFLRMEEKAVIPNRRIRWCCDEYKETRPPKGAVMLMGIRAEESPKRAKSGLVTINKRVARRMILPILHWDSEYLWQFIREQALPYCELYDEGFARLGCVGCPLAHKSNKNREMDRWPGFRRRWQLSFQRIWEKRAGTLQKNGLEWFGSALFKDWREMWDWWLNDMPLPRVRAKRSDW